MCGRFTLTPEEGELRALLGDVVWTTEHRPRYNAAPGQPVPVLVRRGNERRVESMPWGLVPADAPPGRGGWINARVETVATRPGFRDAFQHRRGVVPADGFFEWAERAGRRRPFHLTPEGGGVIGFAAVWEEGAGSGLAILTREASDEIRDLHDRMPVVLRDRAAWDAWLDPRRDARQLLDLVQAPPTLGWRVREVSPVVGSPANDGPECLADPPPDPPEAHAAPSQLSLFG